MSHLDTIAVDRIVVADGHNPRHEVTRDADFDALVSTVRDRGILQPLRVRTTDTGDVVLIAGHRRFAAAMEVGLQAVPVIVRDAGDGTTDEELDLLVDAVIENDHRVDLSLVERARAYDRLKRGGLTVKGIAEKFGRPSRHVSETLSVLKLPAMLQDQLDAGELPRKAVPALLTLGKIHPGLPEPAVRRILEHPNQPWDSLVADPVGFTFLTELPDGVWTSD